MYSGLRLFKTAFMNTRRQIFVSGPTRSMSGTQARL